VITQKWIYSNNLRIVAETDSANRVVSRFVYTTSENVPEYMVKAGVVYSIVTDHLGSVRLIVNTATGTFTQEMRYDEYGRVLSNTNPEFSPFGFGGGIYDAITQLLRLGKRDYHAQLGRWTNKDPLLFAGGSPNIYVSVDNNPVNFTDPTGTMVDPPSQVNWRVNWERAGAAAFAMGASAVLLTDAILEVWETKSVSSLFAVSVASYGLAAGYSNFLGAVRLTNSNIDRDPVLEFVEVAGGFNRVDRGTINFVKLMSAGVVMGLAAEFNLAIKKAVFTLAIISIAEAGFKFGRQGMWQ